MTDKLYLSISNDVTGENYVAGCMLPVRMGKHPDSDNQILFDAKFRTISREHGTIESTPRGLHYTDTSSNGSRVGGLVVRDAKVALSPRFDIEIGDFAAAYRHATRISPAGQLAEYNPHALWVLFDLVEAATRTDRRAEAMAHVMAMREHRIEQLSPRLRMLLDGCTALVCHGAEATLLFERAPAVPEGPRWPFDRARIQLAYGDHLHRGKDPAARIVLAEATAAFHRLGAEPWEARASAVLRASGASVQDRHGTAPDPAGAGLTAREQQIAGLAAQGLSNRQIGEQLYLSPRSVGAALYRIFPKLGITSRAALAAALTVHERQTAGRYPAWQPNPS